MEKPERNTSLGELIAVFFSTTWNGMLRTNHLNTLHIEETHLNTLQLLRPSLAARSVAYGARARAISWEVWELTHPKSLRSQLRDRRLSLIMHNGGAS